MNGGGGRQRRYSSEQLLFDVPANAGGAGVRWAHQQRGGGVRRGDGKIFVSVELSTPSRMRGGDAAAGDSPGLRQQLSPGLLDLHAFDTKLIPDLIHVILSARMVAMASYNLLFKHSCTDSSQPTPAYGNLIFAPCIVYQKYQSSGHESCCSNASSA